jgi:hypothetical protein
VTVHVARAQLAGVQDPDELREIIQRARTAAKAHYAAKMEEVLKQDVPAQ